MHAFHIFSHLFTAQHISFYPRYQPHPPNYQHNITHAASQAPLPPNREYPHRRSPSAPTSLPAANHASRLPQDLYATTPTACHTSPSKYANGRTPSALYDRKPTSAPPPAHISPDNLLYDVAAPLHPLPQTVPPRDTLALPPRHLYSRSRPSPSALSLANASICRCHLCRRHAISHRNP